MQLENSIAREYEEFDRHFDSWEETVSAGFTPGKRVISNSQNRYRVSSLKEVWYIGFRQRCSALHSTTLVRDRTILFSSRLG